MMVVECLPASDGLWDRLLLFLACRPEAAVEWLLGLFTQAVLTLFLALLLVPARADARTGVSDRLGRRAPQDHPPLPRRSGAPRAS